VKKIFVAIALALCATTANAQWPTRAITLIVPFPPGGSTDTIARLMADRMRPFLGQPVVIENAGGAGGTIGVGRVARANPDGYTIDIGQWDTHVGNGVVYPINYDLQKDFEPLGLLSVNAQLVIARKGFPAEDLKGLVGFMRANPGKATMANQNAAAATAGILLQQLTNTKLLFVPYRGAGPAMQDILAGQIDLIIVQAAVATPHMKSGAVKALANMSPARSAVLPIIPTADEQGVKGLYVGGWFGFFAPKGTPREIVARLNNAMVQALADPTVKQRFADLGLDLATREQQSPEGLAAFHKAEIEKWYPIIRAAGIKAE